VSDAPTFAIADLFEITAASVPERTALVADARRLTYAELDERTTRLAHVLRARGVGPGDRLACYLTNRIEHVETMLAAYKARAVPVNVNHRYVAAELQHLLDDADAAAVVHDGEFAATVAEVAPRLPLLRVVVDADDHWDDLVASGAVTRDLGPRSGDDEYVLYTGGTTGHPKGVVWRQEDIVFAVLGGGNPGGPPVTRPQQVAETVRVNTALRLGPMLPAGDPGPEQFVQLALGPLMHASGQWSALGTLVAGGTVVLNTRRSVDMAHVLDLVARERVVALNLVGDASARPLLDTLAAAPGRWDTSSLRLLGSGGTILTAESKRRLLDALPSVIAITEAIGSSESPAQAVAVVTRDGVASARTLAFAPKADTLVLDDDLRPIPAGTGAVGRLATSGRVPLRYHKDPERSARTFVSIDGTRYALPGDMATVDADGTIHLLGRGALCINTGGEKVYPEEVEAVLTAHPAVADAVVVGVPDPRFGEAVAAVVAPTGETRPDTDALREHCRTRLAGYKRPRRVVWVDRVPRSPAGKADYAWARDLVVGTADPEP
jgi:3-oxocholest-4-en-26-oate---CoA ligase